MQPERSAMVSTPREASVASILSHYGILARLPGRILGSHTDDELREILGSCLRSLYRMLIRYELYVTDIIEPRAEGAADPNADHAIDESTTLVPVVKLGEGQFGSGLKLLGALRSRLTLKEDRGSLAAPHAFPSLHGVKRGSIMSAPLLDGTALLGLIIVEAAPGAHDFTSHDLDVLDGVAGLFSLALQRLRAKETGHIQARMDLDLKTARRVQGRFMSATLPAGIGVTAHAEYLPAFDVGGDFYDLCYLSEEGLVGAVIGDVSGKGVSAALVMSRVSSDFRRALATPLSPAEILQDVNIGLAADDESEIFVTASCLKLDPTTRTLRVANAGHIPLIIRRASGEVFTFAPPSGTPLGMLPCEYDEEEIVLGPLDIVLLMTDGLVEALDRPSDRMGLQLLLGLIKYAPHDPRLIHARILEAVQKMKGAKLLDDCTLVALQLEP